VYIGFHFDLPDASLKPLLTALLFGVFPCIGWMVVLLLVACAVRRKVCVSSFSSLPLEVPFSVFLLNIVSDDICVWKGRKGEGAGE
jgi:hypothetical protein